MNQLFLSFNERRRLHDRAYRAQQRDQSEVCGAVIATRRGECRLWFLENVGGRPGHFEIRDRDLKAVRAAVEGERRRVVGVFHSHVLSEAVPGRGDLQGLPMGYLQLIYDVCGRSVRVWRVVRAGSRRVAKEAPTLESPEELEVVRKKIEPGTRVKVTFTDRERTIVLEHTLAGPDVTASLDAAQEVGGRFAVQYTLEDLDELLGFIAAEANHSKSKKLQKELDALWERLQGVMESFDDGQWQTAF